MGKFFIMALCFASLANAIVAPNAYFSFEGDSGAYGAGSNANPAWAEKVSGLAPGYIGSTTAPTYPGITNDGIKGDALYASDPAKSGGTMTLSWTSEVKDVFTSVQSYTICGWVNTRDESANGSESYILKGWGAGPALKWRGDGRMQALDATDGTWRYAGWGEGYSNGDWVFFAITRDSTSIRYYFGSETGAVIAGAAATGLSLAATGTSTRFVLAGNTYNGTDPYFNADMDELRIYSAADNSGALSLAQLEEIRQFDIVPEPATMALFGLGMLIIRRRK